MSLLLIRIGLQGCHGKPLYANIQKRSLCEASLLAFNTSNYQQEYVVLCSVILLKEYSTLGLDLMINM